MFYISTDKSKIDPVIVEELLKQTYWAQERPMELIKASIENSLCFGVYLKETDELIGFARAVTDYSTAYYLADVIIDENYRGKGAGKLLVNAVITNEQIGHLHGHLITRDAHGLYAQYGFETSPEAYMGRRVKR